MLGYDAESTYFNRAETKISRTTAPNLKVAFTVDLGGNITGSPLQVADRLYAAAAQQRTVCYDLTTQQLVWEVPAATFTSSSTFAYSDGTLFVHDFGGVIRALNAADGTQQWELDTSDYGFVVGFSSPIIAGDLVIVGGSTGEEILPGAMPGFRGFVFAANKNTGQLAWKEFTVPEGATGAALWSTPSADVAGGRVYAGTGNNYTMPATDTSDAILALNFDTGVTEWKAQRYEGDVWSLFTASLGNPDYDFGANPVVFEAAVNGTMTELVAAGQKSGDVHVLRRDTGAEVWKRNISPGSANGRMGIFTNGAWDGEHLLFAGNGATSDAPGSEPQDSSFGTAVLFALDPATGNIVWERQLPGPVLAPITVANGVGFVPADRHLIVFDTSTGQTLFRHTAASTIASAPTVSNGRVAFGSGIGWSVGTPGTILTVLDLP
jgi:polyvinyl alcohol dehydrogenase (cytochrome)